MKKQSSQWFIPIALAAAAGLALWYYWAQLKTIEPEPASTEIAPPPRPPATSSDLFWSQVPPSMVSTPSPGPVSITHLDETWICGELKLTTRTSSFKGPFAARFVQFVHLDVGDNM